MVHYIHCSVSDFIIPYTSIAAAIFAIKGINSHDSHPLKIKKFWQSNVAYRMMEITTFWLTKGGVQCLWCVAMGVLLYICIAAGVVV